MSLFYNYRGIYFKLYFECFLFRCSVGNIDDTGHGRNFAISFDSCQLVAGFGCWYHFIRNIFRGAEQQPTPSWSPPSKSNKSIKIQHTEITIYPIGIFIYGFPRVDGWVFCFFIDQLLENEWKYFWFLPIVGLVNARNWNIFKI